MVRHKKRCVAAVLVLCVLSSGHGGEASTPSVSTWTWVQRAFAPAAHHRREALGGSRPAPDEGEADERNGPRLLWMKRALTPSAVGAHRTVPAQHDDELSEAGEWGKAEAQRQAQAGPSLMREMLCSGGHAQEMAFCVQPVIRAGLASARQLATPACARQPHTRAPQRPVRQASRTKSTELRPLQALSATSLPFAGSTDNQMAKMASLNVSAVFAVTPELARGRQGSMVARGRQGSIRAQGVHSIAPIAMHGEQLKPTAKPAFGRRDLVRLVAGVQEMTKSIKEMTQLPISPALISSVMDLAQVWQRLLEAHQALTGSAGETAKGLQAASAMAFKYVADPLIGSSQDYMGGLMKKNWGSLDDVLENLVLVSKGYSVSASWLYAKALELDPTQMPEAVIGISQVTLDTIGLLNRGLETLLRGEVENMLGRFDRELLGINRPNTQTKNSATCMVMGEAGTARVLKYGEAIPQLLYNDEGWTAFESSMSVVLNTDDKGNLYLGPPGSHGVELPLSSDVMWMRQMASYSASITGNNGEHMVKEDLAPATVAAVTIPVNANGDVLLTQRAFRGMYDGMWVFPGGHVDSGESLMTAAVREVREETGLAVDGDSLQPLAVWEGAVSSRKKQFCVIFFAADAMCANAQECSMELQTKEVHRAAWVSRDLLARVLDTHVLHSDLEIDGVLIKNEKQQDTKIKMSELQNGLGEGHKFALRAYLDTLQASKSACGQMGKKSPIAKESWVAASSGETRSSFISTRRG